MTDPTLLWRIKLAAWLHDPAEKALVLMRDPGVSHEQGTARALREHLGLGRLTDAELATIRRADHWAAAADRPNFDQQTWVQVRFASDPEIVHPLSGQRFNLQPLREITAAHAKEISFEHFSELADACDLRRTHLAFWRFGPETPASGALGTLWGLLPADSRVPDHTIWDHLGLVSALAGAFAADADNDAALLAVALGPVQDFIATARKASDLWAGSHLLSTLVWQAMRVVCERLGPDAILFPQLRDNPLVDAWLQNECKLPESLFKALPWRTSSSDANPLFSASLPNKFVAIVPAAQAADIAKEITEAVRAFALDQACNAAKQLAEAAGADAAAFAAPGASQIAGFPEVHWAAVPWSLAGSGPDPDALTAAALPFRAGESFFASTAWGLLSKEILVDGHSFFKPNPGVLYPALYDLLDRVLAAAKSTRAFAQLPQPEPRCSLCGERTILGNNTDPWTAIAGNEPALAKRNEHLCALCSLKRLWPRLFADWARQQSGNANLSQYHVSTHTMALATTFGQLKDHGQWRPLAEKLRSARLEPVALPRNLSKQHGDLGDVFRLLPDALDRAEEEGGHSALAGDFTRIAQPPENYYALLLMDGDAMGAWLSGGEGKTLQFRQGWHSRVANSVAATASVHDQLLAYLDEHRPVSPARHAAISEALHTFASVLAPVVVEDLHKGKIIYAGGDDLFAMISLDDLLPCMAVLRAVYRGDKFERAAEDLTCKNGFARCRGRAYGLMGERATASMGAVIAHFSNPLGRVLRELRAAEHDAKQHPGKDAFSIRLLKRSGGASHLTLPFRSGDLAPIEALRDLCDALASPELSRRAAYHIIAQRPLLPPHPAPEMLESLLAYQFARQGGEMQTGRDLARAAHALDHSDPAAMIEKLLTLAEFLAREGRAPGRQAQEAHA